MASFQRIVLVGHCGFDGAALQQAAREAAPDAEVVAAGTEHALAQAGPESLLLVNRVLDGAFGTGSGVELIRRLNERPDPPAMMLVSNYGDAQADAEAAGALPGFGKNDLGSALVRERIQAAG